jgi:hypothetical protein
MITSWEEFQKKAFGAYTPHNNKAGDLWPNQIGGGVKGDIPGNLKFVQLDFTHHLLLSQKVIRGEKEGARRKNIPGIK